MAGNQLKVGLSISPTGCAESTEQFRSVQFTRPPAPQAAIPGQQRQFIGLRELYSTPMVNPLHQRLVGAPKVQSSVRRESLG